ncbi:hypothetical protein EMIHUDRAFT_123143, partial [Emiliania huxleyi CCMP1516]
WGIWTVKTAYDVEVYFDGLYRAHDKTEYPMLGYNYVSGVWQARHGRGAHTLLGERAFSEPSCTDEYLVNLTMYHPSLGLGTAIAKWARVGANSTAAAGSAAAAAGPGATALATPTAAAAGGVLLLAAAALAAAAWRKRGSAEAASKPVRASLV